MFGPHGAARPTLFHGLPGCQAGSLVALFEQWSKPTEPRNQRIACDATTLLASCWPSEDKVKIFFTPPRPSSQSIAKGPVAFAHLGSHRAASVPSGAAFQAAVIGNSRQCPALGRARRMHRCLRIPDRHGSEIRRSSPPSGKPATADET
jgi:hypothetical protein